MDIRLSIIGGGKSLIIEPWGEEFDIESKSVELIFNAKGENMVCNIEVDCSEEGFLRVENPSGFRPVVFIDGQEDERPVFSLS